MHIERLLKDVGGTKVRLGSTEYHFKELWPEGPHVAPVEDEAHRKVFLLIPEGYREYEGHIPQFQVGNAAIADLMTSAVPVAPAPVQPPAPPVIDQQEPDTNKGEGGDDGSEGGGDGGAGGDKPTGDDLARFEGGELTPEDDTALRALFKDEIGRAASPKSKPETMIAQIRAKRDEAKTTNED